MKGARRSLFYHHIHLQNSLGECEVTAPVGIPQCQHAVNVEQAGLGYLLERVGGLRGGCASVKECHSSLGYDTKRRVSTVVGALCSVVLLPS